METTILIGSRRVDSMEYVSTIQTLQTDYDSTSNIENEIKRKQIIVTDFFLFLYRFHWPISFLAVVLKKNGWDREYDLLFL